MFKNFLTLLFALVLVGATFAQTVWTEMPESGIPATGERRIQPSKFRAARLDVAALRGVLASAPTRFAEATESSALPILSVPMPDGGMARFQIEETPVMHPDLQAKYPGIRTYTGRGIDDPTAVLKCDLTPWGFHAMIRSALNNTVFIDPAVHGNTEYYVVYHKKDYLPKKSNAHWSCEVESPEGAQEIKLLTPAQFAEYQGDTRLRRYRLALACTGEYASFHGGTVPLVLAAMNTTMSRVNGVYERDFAVTMQIVANNDLLVFLNPSTDPYSNGNGSAMLNQNQTTCNNVIGAANYDIGHVFSTGGGGIAGLSVVCGNGKARGVTGQGSPVGDPFDIDYVAHEIGHQFGGNHTYGNCGSNVNNPAAVEPGSGTTIMAYAGICGGQNVAPNSGDYFHGYNILEMGAFIYTGSGNNCPVKINTTNNNPTVDAGPNRNIPKSTPFALTAIGADVNGDTLTYTWEQMDWGNAPSPPSANATVGPLFRSFKGTTSPTRYFPRLQDLVNNINPTWERLPGVARDMNFRVVVRDNHWFAGCTAEDDVKVTVAGNSGPFLVTVPNTNVLWYVGSTETVTWDVANTTDAPVSCSNVRITLSTDGGFTYPIELAANVPNNGSANIIVPNNVSNTCRIRVESVGNIFFDISNANFRIQLPPFPTFFLNLSETNFAVCAETDITFEANLTGISGFNDEVTLSLTGLPAGAVAEITPNPLVPDATATITITGLGTDATGDYTLIVTGEGGGITQTASVGLILLPEAPDVPMLTAPANGTTGVGQAVALQWDAVPNIAFYNVQVSTTAAFAAGDIVAEHIVTSTDILQTGLADATVYYWRVRSSNDCNDSEYSGIWAFQTGVNSCDQVFASSNVPVAIASNSISTAVSTLDLAASNIINDLNLSLVINHSWVGDLAARLVSPHNDTLLLFDQPGVPADQFGCDGSNANLTFDSQAAQGPDVLENQCNGTSPALNGTFQPIQDFGLFNGKNAAGIWQLLVTDNFEEDGGAIAAWSLTLCLSEPAPAGNILVNSPLNVYTGQSEAIFQSNLSVELNGIPEQALYTILSLPAHGTLSVNGTPLGLGGTFTQEDINNNVLVYTNNGDGAATDEFQFDVLDQNNNAWVHQAVFLINVLPNNLAATALETANIGCNGASDGQITVNATGLDGNYNYRLNGGPSQGDNVFSGLPAGTYTVVVTGLFGFTAVSNAVVLNEPAGISVSTDVDEDDVTVTASGGVGALEYSLDSENFQISNEFFDLPNGFYTVTVRDENGCTTNLDFVVAVNNLVADLSVQAEINCGGASEGVLIVNVTGAFPPLMYSLNGGPSQSSEVFTGLLAGSYTVEVTDALGLTTTSNEVVLDEPEALQITADVVLNVINASATGGTGALEYSINGTDFQSDGLFGNLSNGSYTVTVLDETGCTASIEVVVDVAQLAGNGSFAPIPCFGGNTTLTINATDGIPPYEYSLDNGVYQSDNTFSGLLAGTYAVDIRDAFGTVLSLSIDVVEPAQLTVAAVVTGNDAALMFAGGTQPYSFTSDAPDPDLQNLPNGTYNVTATDANGCSTTTTFTVNVLPVSLTATVINLLCNGGANGSITATGAGGIPPYNYSIGGAFQSDTTFSGLPAGDYTLTVEDSEGTQTSTVVTITEPDALELAASAVGNTITASASGGTPPYQYSLNGGTAQSSGVFAGLPEGEYTVMAIDANGCTVSGSENIIISSTIEPNEVWGLVVSPNPSSGLFVLSMQNAPGTLRAEVFDATGRLLQSLHLKPLGAAFTTTLDLHALPQGIYFLRLSDGKDSGAVRLSKM